MIGAPTLSQMLNQLGHCFLGSGAFGDSPDGRSAVFRSRFRSNQHFFVSIAVMGDGRVGQIEDFLRRAVILHQFHNLEVGV